MSGIDYSKWDKMAGEMSDNDDDVSPNHPEVTAFEEPQSVTFGGNIGASQDPLSASHGSGTNLAATSQGTTATTASPLASKETIAMSNTRTSPTDEQLCSNGRKVEDARTGQLRYVWRQTRQDVVVVVPVPSETRAANVVVSLKPKPTTFTEGVADVLQITVKSEKLGDDEGAASSNILEGELSFQCKVEEEVDWELKSFPETCIARARLTEQQGQNDFNGALPRNDIRGVEVTLRKHCPIPGVTVWWRCLLKGDPEIDVTKIKGRSNQNNQSTWAEAMGMFKNKMAEKKRAGKIAVDTGENS